MLLSPLGGGGEALAACDASSYTILPPGGSISGTIATEIALGATEVNICVEGGGSGPPLCPDGIFYDNIDVNGIDLHIIADPTHPEICIVNPTGSVSPMVTGLSCGGYLVSDRGCGRLSGQSTIRIRNSSDSSIGGFSRIANSRGHCALDVQNSELIINANPQSSLRFDSSAGLAFHVLGTTAAPAHVEFYSGSIEESVVGLVLHGSASFAGNDVHIMGHSELAVEAMGDSSLVLVDSSIQDNMGVAWLCDDAAMTLDYVGIDGNPIAALAPGSHGIWLEDQASMDAFNIIAHHNDVSLGDQGFIHLQDDSELSLASSTFADNEASYEIQWIDDTQVDIVDSIFHDSTKPVHTSVSDALFCGSSLLSTADHVNGYRYLHGTSAGLGTDGFVPLSGGASVWTPTSSTCRLTNNLSDDPRFLTGTYNAYYLQQSGPPSTMIDAGSDDADVIYDFASGDWTTDPDTSSPAADSSTVALGFHQLAP